MIQQLMVFDHCLVQFMMITHCIAPFLIIVHFLDIVWDFHYLHYF